MPLEDLGGVCCCCGTFEDRKFRFPESLIPALLNWMIYIVCLPFFFVHAITVALHP